MNGALATAANSPTDALAAALLGPDAVPHEVLVVVAVVVALLAVALLAVVEWRGRVRHRRDLAGGQRVRILPGPRVDPAGAVMFWQHLLGLLPHRWYRRRVGHVVFEYTFTADGLEVSVWVPGCVPAGLVAAAARSAWPGSRTTTEPAGAEPVTPGTPDTETGSSSAGVAGGVLRLARPQGLPIRTDHPVDPLRALLGAVGPLQPGHAALVQVLARPISGVRLAARAHGGSSAGQVSGVLAWVAGVVAAGLAALVQEFVELIVHGPGHRSHGWSSSHTGLAARSHAADRARSTGPGRGVARRVDSVRDRAIAGKVTGAGGGYRAVIRYLATTTPTNPSPDSARTADHASVGRAHAMASAFAEFSGHNHYRRRPLRRPHATITGRRLRGGDAVSVAELAALAHLPTDDHVPGLRRAGAAAIAPPPQVPRSGPQVRPLGDSDAITARPVGITVTDARHHLWIIGATGAGKSTLMVHGVLADAAAGRSAVVLDPKGDLITDIYTRLPDRARARTVLIDPDRPPADGRWPCLNPLDPPRPTRSPTHGPVHGQGGTAQGGAGLRGAGGDVAVENVVSVFARVFSSAWGHRSEDLLRVACLTLRTQPGPASLADLPALLTNPAVRRHVVARLRPDSPLRQFWDWFDQLPDSARAQIGAPLLNKLRAILLRPFAAQLLCGPSTVDLPRLLDTGGLLLVRLPKGVLGEDTVRLIGSLLVSQVWHAALGRAAQPEHQRRDASLLLDECHNFLHLPYRIEDMLAEARGFRLSLTLAHQHLAQLTPALRDGIATNARNKILFAVSPDDATHLARHTLPELGAHDLAHLDGFHAAARLMTGNSEARAFTLTTRPLPPMQPPPPSAAPGRVLPRPGARGGPPPHPRPRHRPGWHPAPPGPVDPRRSGR